jgi:hypothetical protein
LADVFSLATILTFRSPDITRSFCAPAFDPTALTYRPAITMAASPVKVKRNRTAKEDQPKTLKKH